MLPRYLPPSISSIQPAVLEGLSKMWNANDGRTHDGRTDRRTMDHRPRHKLTGSCAPCELLISPKATTLIMSKRLYLGYVLVGKPGENEGIQYILWYEYITMCINIVFKYWLEENSVKQSTRSNFWQRTTVIILLESIKPICNPITLNPDRNTSANVEENS